jgi:hypothetical protein
MTDTTNIKLANTARNEAVRTLIEKHNEEYRGILAETRKAKGLPGDPDIAKKRKQVEKAAERLKALGVTVNLDEMLAALDN